MSDSIRLDLHREWIEALETEVEQVKKRLAALEAYPPLKGFIAEHQINSNKEYSFKGARTGRTSCINPNKSSMPSSEQPEKQEEYVYRY